jgi:hypothetical protein
MCVQNKWIPNYANIIISEIPFWIAPVNKLNLLRRTQQRFTEIAPDMQATCFSPFAGHHQVCLWRTYSLFSNTNGWFPQGLQPQTLNLPLPKRRWRRVEKPKHVAGLDVCDSWFIALVLKTQRDYWKYFFSPKSEKPKVGWWGKSEMALLWPICHIHTQVCDQNDGKRACYPWQPLFSCLKSIACAQFVLRNAKNVIINRAHT